MTAATSKKPRVRKPAEHRSFKITRKRLKQSTPIPGALTIFKQTLGVVRRNKRIFLGLAGIHALLSYVFIQGLGTSLEINDVKKEFEDLLGGGASGKATTGIALMSYLVSSSAPTASEGSNAYQVILTIVLSLAIIWLVRQIFAEEKPTIRDALYKGMYPLIPFVLVLIVILIQLIPLVAGNIVLSTVVQQGLAVSAVEKFVWLLLFLLTALLSIYMVASSIFALYIVTLPDARPWRSLKSARELVLHRRLAIGLRVVALPVILALIAIVVFIPMLLFFTVAAQPLFLILSSLGVIITHIYFYILYRSLL